MIGENGSIIEKIADYFIKIAEHGGKIAKYLEIIGCLCILGAFTTYYVMWRESDMLWWSGLILVMPKIVYDTWSKSFGTQVFRAFAFIILIILTKWWFGGPVIKVNIPGLPPVTIERQQQYKIL